MDLEFLDASKPGAEKIGIKLSIKGQLQMYVNGELTVPELSTLKYWNVDGSVRHDDKIIFQFILAEKMQKALVLRIIAASAGVPWEGDEPEVCSELQLRDGASEDLVEFRLSADGKLSEYQNGELLIEEVGVLEYSAADSTITDEADGTFQIGFDERTEKSILLRSMAVKAGVEWVGEEPKPLALFERKAKLSQGSILKVFQAFGTNKDGFIQEAELRRVLVELGLPEQEVVECFAGADANGNGVLDYGEFVAWVCSAFEPVNYARTEIRRHVLGAGRRKGAGYK
eukprot:TRINITY_DN91326_c0_g1_i1.p1 TRINITY_DN91326_c0_g1~~TRINITY_DN91326_c0_g1_i1.p1  ORF type:complete len:296 (+),score=60.68 TRINITY_DN91326_c0_g1_i1:35-889(+)